MNRTATIGRVARETGLTIDTIRFYEKQGLLKRSARTEGGFRVFGADDVQCLRFVRNAQQLGFSLREIRELLILRADQVPSCSHVRELLDQKLDAVAQKIRELKKLEHSLQLALRKCDGVLRSGTPSHQGRCPVLDEINSRARKGGQC